MKVVVVLALACIVVGCSNEAKDYSDTMKKVDILKSYAEGGHGKKHLDAVRPFKCYQIVTEFAVDESRPYDIAVNGKRLPKKIEKGSLGEAVAPLCTKSGNRIEIFP